MVGFTCASFLERSFCFIIFNLIYSSMAFWHFEHLISLSLYYHYYNRLCSSELCSHMLLLRGEVVTYVILLSTISFLLSPALTQRYHYYAFSLMFFNIGMVFLFMSTLVLTFNYGAFYLYIWSFPPEAMLYTFSLYSIS